MKKILRCAIAGILILIIAGAETGQSVKADEDRQSLEECLAGIKQQIDANNTALDEIYNKIMAVNEKIAANEMLIPVLEETMAVQKADMVTRIKYMYESGSSMDMLAAILSAESISDALNKAAYISQVITYDRKKLQEYADTVARVQTAQVELEQEKAELSELWSSFQQANMDFEAQMTVIIEKIEAYDLAEEEAARTLEEYMRAEAEREALQKAQAEETSIQEMDEEQTQADTEKNETEEPMAESVEDITEEPAEESTEDVTEEPSEESTEDVTEEPTETPTEEPTEVTHDVPIDTYSFTEDEIYDLARITYLEDGCMYPTASYKSIYLVACVVLNRAINWYDGSLHDAIYAPGQYATAYRYTNWGGGELNINDITWEAVNDALSNLDPNPYYQCNGDWLSGMGLTEYYRDPVTDEVFYYDY